MEFSKTEQARLERTCKNMRERVKLAMECPDMYDLNEQPHFRTRLEEVANLSYSELMEQLEADKIILSGCPQCALLSEEEYQIIPHKEWSKVHAFRTYERIRDYLATLRDAPKLPFSIESKPYVLKRLNVLLAMSDDELRLAVDADYNGVFYDCDL